MVIKHEQNQKDINFRLNRLEYMHYIEHDPKQIDDPKYEFPLHNGEEEMETTPVIPFGPTDNNDTSSSSIVHTDASLPQTNHLQRIDSVESSVNDIKSEIGLISSALRSITQSFSSSN